MNQKKEVLGWIAESKKKGYSKDQIESELKKRGYDSDIIRETLGNNKNSTTKIFITALVILLLGVGGYVAFTQLSMDGNELIVTAMSLDKEGKTEEAIEYYQKIIDKYPEMYSARFPNFKLSYFSSYYIGSIYFRKKEFELAIPYFQKAIEIHPEKAADSNNKLGQIYFLKGDYATALPYLTTSLEIDQKSEGKYPKSTVANAHYLIGRIYKEKADYGIAIEHLKSAYDLAPDSANINYHLGEAYYLNKQYAEAASYLNNYTKLNPTGENIEKAKKYLGITK